MKFEGEYLNGKKWNGTIYDNINNFTIIIKSGIYKVDKYDYIVQFISEDEYIIDEKNGKVKN